MNDPVSDLFVRIKNALLRKKELVDMPSSRLKEEITRVLSQEGFIAKHEVMARGGKKILRINLKYGLDKFGKPAYPLIKCLSQVSKPGRRIYSAAQKLRPVQSGFGIAIVSTPQGIMTGEAARKKKVGGEVIAYVY